ncbi:MAG: hypothetical protein ABI550_01505 [Ignavibacteriaceae bacterium]
MKKIFAEKNIKFLFLIFALVLLSCREEVVAPDNPAGNINEPVQYSTRNSYTFLINADKISEKVSNFPNLNSTAIRLFITIQDISSGSVLVSLSNKDNQVWYADTYGADIDNHRIELLGNSPEIISIRMINFTGKLKVQLTSFK